MPARAACLAALLVAGVCQGPTAHHNSATPTPRRAVARPVSTLPACRLPLVSYPSYVDGITATPGAGGFLNFPAGTFTVDPTAAGSYDRAVSRWIPAQREGTSADGLHYAYASTNAGQLSNHPVAPESDIIVVDARSGAKRDFHFLIWYAVASYEPEGVYLYRYEFNGPRWGLWLLDPSTGSLTTISADQNYYWEQVGHGVAWALTSSAGDSGNPDTLARMDLDTKQITKTPGNPNIQLIGQDQTGQPIMVRDLNPGFDVIVGQATIAYEPSAPINAAPGRYVVTDARGMWFSSPDGQIWLYSGGSFRHIARVALDAPVIAGDCA